MPCIAYEELEMAMMFVSGASLFEASARVSKETGKIYSISDETDDVEPLPDDIDDDERYVEIPNQHDLELGKSLVMKFMGERLPEHYDQVAMIFRRKGAYSRFKAYLEERGRLDEWHKYEQAAVCVALCEWARDEGFEVKGVPDDCSA